MKYEELGYVRFYWKSGFFKDIPLLHTTMGLTYNRERPITYILQFKDGFYLEDVDVARFNEWLHGVGSIVV